MKDSLHNISVCFTREDGVTYQGYFADRKSQICFHHNEIFNVVDNFINGSVNNNFNDITIQIKETTKHTTDYSLGMYNTHQGHILLNDGVLLKTTQVLGGKNVL